MVGLAWLEATVIKKLKREREKLRVEQREIEIEDGIYYRETE